MSKLGLKLDYPQSGYFKVKVYFTVGKFLSIFPNLPGVVGDPFQS